MNENNGQSNSSNAVWTVPLVVLAIIIALAVVWRMLHAPAPKALTVTKPLTPAEVNQAISGQPPIIESAKLAAKQASIDDIIRVRQHWNPAFLEWVGKQAPNFDLATIDGSSCKLSSYKGKTVMLIFWATWCGPCRTEIPGLIELRKNTSPDKLAIVAVSYESGERVRQFLAQNPVNYTVIATPQNIMPPPYQMVNAIPATFFIDKDGIIRLATEGLVMPKETEMILKTLD
jgi:peroxiredoxin